MRVKYFLCFVSFYDSIFITFIIQYLIEMIPNNPSGSIYCLKMKFARGRQFYSIIIYQLHNISIMKRTIFLFLLIFPVLGFAQTNQLSDLKKIGVGIGYSFNSVMSDSIRPVEFSLRYRINDRHTLQLYAPVAMSKRTIDNAIVNTQKKKLFGIGLGYDYTVYNHSFLDFFIGLNASYQWYESRRDWHSTYNRDLGDGSYVETESIYYYWDKVKGMIISPNIGVRFSINRRIMIEPRMNVQLSILHKNSYSFYQTKNTHESGWATWESFYPDKDIKEFEMQAGGSIHLYYYF